jgi:hypothetical protein
MAAYTCICVAERSFMIKHTTGCLRLSLLRNERIENIFNSPETTKDNNPRTCIIQKISVFY